MSAGWCTATRRRRRRAPSRGRGARRPARPTASARGAARRRPLRAQLPGRPWPGPAPLLRAADGWVHPGPPTAWAAFTDMAVALGAPVAGAGRRAPRPHAAHGRRGRRRSGGVAAARGRGADDAGARRPACPSSAAPRRRGATVVVLGTAWATPLVGRVLADLGARVVRVEHPRRPDPVPAPRRASRGARSGRGSTSASRPDRDRVRARCSASADLLVDGHPPRVLANAGLDDDALRPTHPALSVVRVAAFVDDDRPGYGPAAEAAVAGPPATTRRASRRSSVADPVAGLLGALAAVELLTARAPGDARSRLARGRGRAPARRGSGAVTDERLRVARARRDHRDRVRPPADQHLRRRDPRRAVRGAHRGHRRPRRAGRRVHAPTGDHFSAGADLKEFGTAPSLFAMRDARWGRDVWGLLRAVPVPMIASMQGNAVGLRLRARAAVRRAASRPTTAWSRCPRRGSACSRRAARARRCRASWAPARRSRRSSPASGSRQPPRSRAASSTRSCRVPSCVPAPTSSPTQLAARPTAAVRAAKAAVWAALDLPLAVGSGARGRPRGDARR